jgi:hypothetical protein
VKTIFFFVYWDNGEEGMEILFPDQIEDPLKGCISARRRVATLRTGVEGQIGVPLSQVANASSIG